MNVEQVSNENVNEMRDIYNNFVNVAIEDFLFELPALSFQDFKANFQDGFVKAYMCKDTEPEGFLLYSDNLTESIEITLIYARNNDKQQKTVQSVLQTFLDNAAQIYKNKTISYPMIGVQRNFIQDAINCGFSTIGQQILEFNFHNTTSLVTLASAKMQNLQNNYKVTTWDDKYFDDASKTIYQEFSQKNDAKFDVRFRSLAGTTAVLKCITQELYGIFLPKATSVLLYDNKPVGYCFINLSTDNVANIPLLVIDKNHQGNGFGALLVQNSLTLLKNSDLKLIGTTADKENISAIKTYTKLGFQKKHSYYHAYKQI